MPPAMSNLARKFDSLQERAERKPIHATSIDTLGDTTKKPGIGHLKEFYLQRLAKTEPNAAARLGGAKPVGQETPSGGGPLAAAAATGSPTSAATTGGFGAQPARPNFAQAGVKDIEDLEVMCNNCFSLIRSSEALQCTGEPASCPLACRNGNQDATSAVSDKPVGQIALIDLKLKKLRAALDARLQDSSSKVNVMRHLTQLRYHIDTAAKWQPGCSEIGALSDHTLQQVKQLTATSRVLAPAVYIFSKRITNVVVQKERELRKALLQQTTGTKSISMGGADNAVTFDIEHTIGAESVADVNSIVSELDSDCGTQYAETVITQDGQSTDVGNVQDANDYLNLKNEDEQRRWFYAQTLTVKLSLADKTRARKILISDLYARVREQQVPIDGWVDWIRTHLMPEEEGATARSPATSAAERSPAANTASQSLSTPARSGLGGACASPASRSPLSGAAGYPGSFGGACGRGAFGGGACGGAAQAGVRQIDHTVPVPGVTPGAAGAPLSRTQPVSSPTTQPQHMHTPTMQRPTMPGAGGMSFGARQGLTQPMSYARKP